MKKFFKILSLAVCLLAVLAIFVSCGKDAEADAGNKADQNSSGAEETSPDGLPVLHVAEIKNIGEYKLVRAESASNDVKSIFSELRIKLSEYCGEELTLGTDFSSAVKYEILVGETQRKESQNAIKGLGEKDYRIKLDGNKIVIVGGSVEALRAAVLEFTDYFLTGGKILVPTGKGLYYSPVYSLDRISIDGKDISEYKIYAKSADCAERLSFMIENTYSGQKVETVNEMTEDGGPYVILDASSLDYTAYKAEVKDGNLHVSGSFKSCIEFLDYYVKKGEKKVDIKGSIEGNIDAPKLYDKEKLMSVLGEVYNGEPIIMGQQVNADALPSVTIEKYKKATGEEPSILGIDLACYGMKLPTAEPEYVSQVFCELVEFAERGGIITASSHFANPTGNWGDQAMVRGQLGGKEAWDQLLTEGTEYNTVFTEELILDGEFLKLFNDLGLSIIWRPLHEINSGWFWYSIAESGKALPAEYGINLWRYIYDLYEEMGLDQLVWEYSPNNDNSWINVMYCYPGDEYTDIVGLDWYTSGGYEIDGKGKSYASLMATEKITSICEFGLDATLETGNKSTQHLVFSGVDFASLVRTILSDGYKLCYVLTWTAGDSVEWWGKGEEMMESGLILTPSDLKPLFYGQ